MFDKLKTRLQFQAYASGYSKGYYHACKKLKINDGRFVILKHEDIVLGSQFYKRPRFRFRLLPWYSGFEFGMTDAYSFYNAGDDPHNSDESLEDVLGKVQKEFEKDKERCDGWKDKVLPFSQTKQLP